MTDRGHAPFTGMDWNATPPSLGQTDRPRPLHWAQKIKATPLSLQLTGRETTPLSDRFRVLCITPNFSLLLCFPWLLGEWLTWLQVLCSDFIFYSARFSKKPVWPCNLSLSLSVYTHVLPPPPVCCPWWSLLELVLALVTMCYILIPHRRTHTHIYLYI